MVDGEATVVDEAYTEAVGDGVAVDVAGAECAMLATIVRQRHGRRSTYRVARGVREDASRPRAVVSARKTSINVNNEVARRDGESGGALITNERTEIAAGQRK